MPITELSVDDEPLARKRIRRLLHAASGLTMIGKAGNREEAVRILDEKAPRVAFLDVQMPRRHGFERRETRPASPADHVFVLHGGRQLQMSRACSERLDGSWQ